MNNCNLIHLTILGSTGFIGLSALKVIQSNPNLKIWALTSDQNYQLFAQQINQFKPKIVFMSDEKAYQQLKKLSFQYPLIFAQSFTQILQDIDCHLVLSAISGSAGLKPTLIALENAKTVLLANKESLVMAGNLMIDKAKEKGVKIIPVDSEHNAILQCLPSEFDLQQSDLVSDFALEKIVLTASGGSFWQQKNSKKSLKKALTHPNWSMGKKITIDSNSLVNKGLELIEASYLFNLDSDKIDAVIHPQSIVHGLIYFKDNSVLAALANPDMQIAIAYALSYSINQLKSNKNSIRLVNQSKALDLTRQNLEFHPIDLAQFPCFALAKQSLKNKGTYPLFFNAANEVAVALFLAEKIQFDNIQYLIAKVLEKASQKNPENLEEVFYWHDFAQNLGYQLAKKI